MGRSTQNRPERPAWAFPPFPLPPGRDGPDAGDMLIPIPLPVFTLAPDVEELTTTQTRMLNDCLATLDGRIAGVMVIAAKSTSTHEVLELITTNGPLTVMERRPRQESRAA